MTKAKIRNKTKKKMKKIKLMNKIKTQKILSQILKILRIKRQFIKLD